MLEVHIPSVGPEPEEPRQSPEKGHMVFRVEVRCRGRRHSVHRRYSEFHALHKRIKKLYKVPDFPSKRLPNWRTRSLEQRRQGLEAYIQGILYLNQDVPKELLEFLRLRHFPVDPKASSWGSQLHHRPVISFCRDPYIFVPSPGEVPPLTCLYSGSRSHSGVGVPLPFATPRTPGSISLLLPFGAAPVAVWPLWTPVRWGCSPGLHSSAPWSTKLT
ncbi:sorting nexin-22 isoform X2 [Heterocephalus glaber]|uniref:Sorting nexin-22 isoform X2 n=1 Tax=Heterocephalus glaber TaxID=10181 RepID=A0AAX6PNC2_HETGA|nr:sorting nexin-22 isoform X2 [Heterocephalus glaber]